MPRTRFSLVVGLAGMVTASCALATNPLITDQFTADPTARVFEGRIYVYPSHDILAGPARGREGWFCMEDYHVFSSDNLSDWKDHGVIVSQASVEWVDSAKYAMWAPDCVAWNGRYYFYFPALAKSDEFQIGVAIADHPEGPFTPESAPIEGVRGIDPCVFLDRDGSAYLFYSQRKIFVAKLNDNLLEIEGEPQVIANLPTKGLLEGPFVFERNGIYYLTYPHVEHETERLEYATGPGPLGPFTPAGVIMDESASGCWTNHHSIVEYRGGWLIFYHDKDLSPDFDKARSIRADRLFFNNDGTIRKVVPTLRGVGIVDARSEIQIDRTSAISSERVSVSFLDPANTFGGWKVSLGGPASWVRFDDVNFGAGGVKAMTVRVVSATGGTLEVRLDAHDGPVLGRVEVAPGEVWQECSTQVERGPAGVHALVVRHAGGGAVDADWVRFR